MKRILPDSVLLWLSEFVELKLALHFPENKWDDLERHIIAAAHQFGHQEVNEFINSLSSTHLSKERAELLASHLTINETYFWREPITFQTLEDKIVPELLHLKQSSKIIRIWSAGCSGGEEPYSIAIALSRLIPNIENWNISIMATDISPTMLAKAAVGIYGKWSFRGTPSWLQKEYFTEIEKDKFEISPKIKALVNFKYLNLADNTYPSPINNTNAMDIIYCRNVLMYFKQDRFRQIAKNLYNSLINGGYLVVSSSELSSQNFKDFTPINVPGFVLYQKNTDKIKQEATTIKSSQIPFHLKKDVQPSSNANFTAPAKPENKKPEKVTTNLKKPDDPNTLLADYSSGRYEEVISQLMDREKTSEELLLLIRSYANLGKPEEAIEVCVNALSIYKLDFRLHFLYATILRNQNQTNEAINALKKAIFIESDFLLAYYSLGNLFLKTGNTAGAVKSYSNALSLLKKMNDEDIVPESEGLTVGRLAELVNNTLNKNALL